MLQSVGLSSAVPLAMQALPQSSFLLSAVSKVALAAIASFAATLNVVPVFVPAVIIVMIGVSILSSLFQETVCTTVVERPVPYDPPLFRSPFFPIDPFFPRPTVWERPCVYREPVYVRPIYTRPICIEPRVSCLPSRVVPSCPPIRRDLVGERCPF